MAISPRLQTALNRFRGVPIETDLGRYVREAREIRGLHARLGLADVPTPEIGHLAAALRPRLSDAAASPRAEAFALILEATRRATGLAAHDVQIIAGLAMAEGRIAELPTGEGKTLAAVFAAAWFALGGRPVHVLTFNDYLARRDAAWMGPAYGMLGLSVGSVQDGQDKPAKRAAYACHVTYATAKEAGFDYLRDRLAYEPDELVHRPFAVALVDEADSILIDEARIPLVISGTVESSGPDAGRLARLVRDLAPGRDLRDGRGERQRLSHRRRHSDHRVAARLRQSLRHRERGAPGRRPLRPACPGPAPARRRLHRPRRPDRDRGRVHRPGRGQAPLAGRPPGRRRGQGRGPSRSGRPHPRLDPSPAFLPSLSDALRHDRHGRAFGPRVQRVLRAR